MKESNLIGLTTQTAQMRLETEGFNEVPNYAKRGFLRILLEVIQEPMFALLLAGAFIYLMLGDPSEALILLLFACFSLSITLVQEFRSENLLYSLRNLSAPRAKVIRDGVPAYIPGREVVPCDILIVSEGDRVAADAIVLDAHDLLVDESLLTGESVPIVKISKEICCENMATPSQDISIIYAGSLIIKGFAQATVFATGSKTELGKIGGSLVSINIEQPKLKKQIQTLVKYSAIVGALVAILAIFLFAIFRGALLEALLVGIAIGMSMIPEEFPLVIAVFMAMGAWRISRIGVLTRRVSAIETLGSVTILCTDKTGTLTTNTMSVVEVVSNDFHWKKGQLIGHEIINTVRVGLMASAKIPTDPIDLAIHKWIEATGIDEISHKELIHAMDLRPDLLALVNIYQSESSAVTVYVKGAFEAVTLLCKLSAEKITTLTYEVEGLAAQGIRVLALAKLDNIEWSGEFIFRESIQQFSFTYCGLIGFADPLRDEVPDAINACQNAGIHIVMITGDHPLTASAIALQAGIKFVNCLTGDEIEATSDEQLSRLIKQTSIFARIRPHQKLRIVNCLKRQGEIVAMTGDGVNDAPAIKASHVGIAMGCRGTEVAREAATLVLLDDNFASIVKTIRLGRRIYDNLRKAIEYIIAVHIPIAGMALAPLLLDLPLMLAPIHIVFLQMIIDPACSIVFEAEPEESNVMRRPPRDPKSSIIMSRMLLWSVAQGLIALSILLLVLILGYKAGISESELRALVFTQLILINVSLIFINRSFSTSFKSTFSFSNRILWCLVLIISVLLFLSLYWVPLQKLFNFETISFTYLMLCGLLSLVFILFLGYVKKNAYSLLVDSDEK